MSESIINCSNPEQADIIFLGANYDQTSSFGKGADKGPEAIRSCLDSQIEFFDRFSQTCPRDWFRIAYHDLGDLNKVSPEKMIDKIAQEYGSFLNHGKFIVLLGGEHSVTNGPLLAISRFRQTTDVSVLQIDAHFDLRDTDADFHEPPHGKFSHACVMRRAHEMGFTIIQVGIRAYSKEEIDFAENSPRINVFEWGREIPKIEQIVKAVPGQDVYITVDVDGFDPAFMPATGTPVQGGLEWYYGLRLLREIFKTKNVVGFDIVEVAPRSGDSLTEYGAAQLCYSILGFKLEKEIKKQ